MQANAEMSVFVCLKISQHTFTEYIHTFSDRLLNASIWETVSFLSRFDMLIVMKSEDINHKNNLGLC